MRKWSPDHFRVCRSGGNQLEDFLKEIFSSLPFPAGTANKSKLLFNSFSNQSSLTATIDSPKNVMKNNDFYRAKITKSDF
jgi:hypothetical protein